MEEALHNQKRALLAARQKLATAQQDLADEINLTLKHFDRTLRMIERFGLPLKKKKKSVRRAPRATRVAVTPK
jgi:DNA-binding MarR family transcriptional regulator